MEPSWRPYIQHPGVSACLYTMYTMTALAPTLFFCLTKFACFDHPPTVRKKFQQQSLNIIGPGYRVQCTVYTVQVNILFFVELKTIISKAVKTSENNNYLL